MILRLILILLVAWFVFALIRYLKRLGHKTSARQEPSRVEARSMVKCDHCGTHLPAEQAIETENGTYCCTEHRDRHH